MDVCRSRALPAGAGRGCASLKRYPEGRGRPALQRSRRLRRAPLLAPVPPPPTAALRSGKGSSSGGKFGNENRLGSNGTAGSSWVEGAGFIRSVDALEESRAEAAPAPAWRRRLNDKLGQLQYQYFNWRQDTWSDLQLFMSLNLVVFLAGAWVEGAVIRHMDQTVPPPPDGSGTLYELWYNLYKVLAVVLGQDLPAEQAGWPSQAFAVFVAVLGLVSFALVLALVEQVVLEVLESNVKRGSMCYEQGHTVVLAWCESSRDIAQLTRILTQLCAAKRSRGGGVVVVLTQQRGKLEMEQLFREVLPNQHRYGTQFVFRQGSPLDPAALRMAAAVDASRIIVCGDYSKLARDADGQVLRTCVLLDELITAKWSDGGGPIVVAQIKTKDVLPLVHYACSQRVLPVPTNQIIARRYVRLLNHPIAAVFSRCLSDFYSPAHGCIDHHPEVEGLCFADLHCRFPDALVVGLTNRRAKRYQLNPPPEQRVQPGDELIVLRPERLGSAPHRALPSPPHVDLAGWDPTAYIMRSLDEQPLGADQCGEPSCLRISARAHEAALCAQRLPDERRMLGSWAAAGLEPFQSSMQGLFVLPVQYSNTLTSSANELLVCGWMGATFMWELLAELDHSDQALPAGSRVTLFNEHRWAPEVLEERMAQYNIRNLDVRHVRGDPRSRAEMARAIDVSKFKAAIVVCDSMWVDWADGSMPDLDGGLQLLSQAGMLSLDSAMLMVQLNIRLLLEEANHPAISIICEKLTYVGITRFEDDSRLPMGIAVNSASYAAKTLAQVAINPRFLRAYMELGTESDLLVQDASAFAAAGERLSFLQLQARATSVRQVLLGWYVLPTSPYSPLEMVVNPQGLEERSKPRVWNASDSLCKLVTVALTKRNMVAEAVARTSGSQSSLSASFASLDVGSQGSGGGGSGEEAERRPGWAEAPPSFDDKERIGAQQGSGQQGSSD